MTLFKRKIWQKYDETAPNYKNAYVSKTFYYLNLKLSLGGTEVKRYLPDKY